MEPIVEFTNFPKARFNSVNPPTSQCEFPAATESPSPTLKRILLMTDFSARGRMAYTHAAELAKKHDADITLTHFGRSKPPNYSDVSIRDHRREQFDNLNNERGSPTLAGVRTSSRLVVHRSVVEAVRMFENEVPSDLVVVYASATTRFGRFSSIDYVGDLLIGASVPVLMVGPNVEPLDQGSTGVALVPFDLRRNTGAPFDSINWVAKHFDYSFQVSQVTRSTSTGYTRWFDLWSRWRQANSLRRATTLSQQLEKINSNGSIELQSDLQIGEPINSNAVAKRAREMNASLIVVSDDRSLRNRVLNLVRESLCPVLAVPNPI